MIIFQSEEQKARFKEHFTLIDFKYEYPGFEGEIRYGLYSDLPESSQKALFGDILVQISPYIPLDKGYAEVRHDFRKNEKKFQYRNAVCNQFSIDDDFEEHHPEAAMDSFEDELIRADDYKMLSIALGCLSDIQRKRIEKHFYMGMTVREIANEEGVDHAAIVRSIQASLKKMKKYFD